MITVNAQKFYATDQAIRCILFCFAFILVSSSQLYATTDTTATDKTDPSILNSGLITVGDKNSDTYLTIGGALRYNLYLEDYGGKIRETDSEFTFDTWRVNVEGRAAGININFEYRFYPTFGTHFVKQGWLGYDFNDNVNLQVGVTQVPFGLLQYASHNWWFQLPYYLGLEDDHDMGFKLTTEFGNWNLAGAFFMQSDPNGIATFAAQNTARYSYDIVPAPDQNQSNSETNQANLRVAYNWNHGKNATTEIGLSGQFGGIYNSVFDHLNYHYAVAPHIDATLSNFNIKAEFIRYYHKAINNNGQFTPVVKMAAYGSAPYDVAAKGNMYVLGAAYNLDVDWGPISGIKFYDNYTYLDKTNTSFADSQHNVLGFMVSAGNLYTYFDIASGKNQPWLTDDFGTGLGPGVQNPRINTRFNINIGYYF